jgi:2-aminoadipate transaminase
MEKLIVAKQAADLHTTHFTQCILWRYLKDNDIEKHVNIIKEAYSRQARAMLNSIEKYFPQGVSHTIPEGGMFLWVTLPEGTSSRDLLDLALKDKVIFVPGDPFYVNRRNTNTLRLNFSCTDEATIDTGIRNLGEAMKQLLNNRGTGVPGCLA